MDALIDEVLDRLQSWVEGYDYRGYEPFDGLGSPIRSLVFGSLLGERVVQQVFRQCPLNLRPLLGVKRLDSTKGRGFMAWGYLSRFRTTGNPAMLSRAEACLDWLDQNKSPFYQDHSWGNHFDYVSRGGRIPKHEPTIVWTALIGQPYLDAYELTGNAKYLEVAKSVCRWILSIPREHTPTGDCLSYVAFGQGSVHNANMLGAAMLGRTWKHTKIDEYLEVANSAMRYSCTRQLVDGSWWYGEAANRRWIDNFHTGYNLCALKTYIENTGVSDFRPSLNRGLQFFRAHFFEESGRPRYYHNRTYPVDIQCCAQAIETLLCDDQAAFLGLAKKVANWAIENMLASEGYFYYRQYPFMKAKAPMIHWGQATMFRALAELQRAARANYLENVPPHRKASQPQPNRPGVWTRSS